MRIAFNARSGFRCFLFFYSLLLASVLDAQIAPTNSQDSSISTRARTAKAGPNYRSFPDNLTGRQVVQMATGMNYWDGKNWVPSEARFEVTDDGFAATRVQAKVRLSANLNASGAVRVVTQDGITLNSTPIGIGLFDTETGQSMIIASIQNTEGTLIGDNWVVYENAFNGVCADVIYKIDQATFEQDVVITGKLNPEDYGFPSKTTRVQVFTEFYGAPEPDTVRRPLRVEQDRIIRQRMAAPDLVDEILGFGEFVIGTGRASTLSNIGNSGVPSAAVVKEFKDVEGRSIMIESVEYGSVVSELETLPDCSQKTASIQPPVKRAKLGASDLPTPSWVEQVGLRRKANRSGIAKADLTGRKGMVIDYLATIGGTLSSSTVFAGDTTYFLTSAVTCNGAVTIEGGAVIKFPTNSTSFLKVANTLTCKTSSYRPAIFTAGDDDTVGDKITTGIWSSYTGTIRTNGYGNPALWITGLNNHSVSNLSFRYSQEAVRFEGSGGSGTLSHSQLAWCIRGVVLNLTGSSGTGITVTANNNLMSNVQLPISINNSGSTLKASHLTVDTATRLITSSVAAATTRFTNSVFANIPTVSSGTVDNSGINNGFYNGISFGSSQFSSGGSPFQAVGAGYSYLAAGSSFRNIGLTNLPATLLADLRKRTTYPPVVLTSTITMPTVLSPQAACDTDTPDLGYHYDPIDYAVNTLTVTNATLVLTNGVTLAAFGNNALWLTDGAFLYSEGTPQRHNHLTRHANVQEQPINWGNASLGNTLTVNPYNFGVSPASAEFRFTDFDGLAGFGYHTYMTSANWVYTKLVVLDCSLSSGMLAAGGYNSSVLSFTNNLFERVYTSFQNSPQVNYYNNLYRYGSVDAWNGGASTWTIKDNAFDSTVVSQSGTLVHANNAYIAMGSNRFTPTNVTDKVMTNFFYTVGPLGSYYQNTNALVDIGSRNANSAALYHYATTTNVVSGLQVKEGTSVVDIGFHYVAVDSAGLPIDTDGDGWPDYLEDRNGDGNGANDSTSWQSSDSGLGNGAAALQVFTPLK